MKLFISITLIILFGVVNCFSQTKIDSLTKLISKSKIDTSKLSLYLQIGIEYKNKNQDSASYFFEKVKKSTSKNNKFYVAQSYFEIAVFQFENKNNSQIADSLLNICLTK